MRIIFLSVNDEFAGRMQELIYKKHPDWIVGSVISTTEIYKKTRFAALLFVIKKSGLFYFFEMVRMKILKQFSKNRYKNTPLSLAKLYNKEVKYSKNINKRDDVAWLKNHNPDFIISTNFSHYVGKNVRQLGPYGVWNVHKSYLPNFRGMAPNFYALLYKEVFTGVTIHVIDEGFDTGPILTQTKIPIKKEDTVYSLNIRASEEGGKLLLNFLERFNQKTFNPIPQIDLSKKYYTYPTADDIKAFYKQGLKFS